jgi:uncharacterized protein
MKGIIMDQALLDVIVCPLCKGKLMYEKEASRLICQFDKLAYPICDGIPVMLIDKAESLTPKES